MEPVRWGILGTGWIAGSAIAPALAELPGAVLHSVLSRDGARAQAFCAPYGARAHAERDAFLADRALEAVYIATPNFRHVDDVLACAAAGKHVLCDKPLAPDAAQAARLVEACARGRVQLGVGLQLRFHPAHREMARRLAAGMLGTVSHAQAQMCFRYPEGPSPWRRERASAGGGWASADFGSHLAYLLLTLLGPARRVHAVLGNRVYGYDGEDLCMGLVEFESGATASLLASTGTDGGASVLSVHGADGYLTAEGTLGLVPGGTLRAGRGFASEPVPFGFEHPTLYHAELDAFGAALRGGAPFPVPGEAGVAAAALLDALRAAGRSGRPVAVAPR